MDAATGEALHRSSVGCGNRRNTDVYLHRMDGELPFVTVTGCPALSLPAGFRDGLPVGAQLVAPLRADAFLLRAAKAIEAITGFATQAPSLSAV